MALQMRKFKRPPREVKQMAERMKISGKVFDDRTLMVLHYLLSNGVVASIDSPIAQGKEAVVFSATAPAAEGKPGGYLAVKIFKNETTSFHKRMQYMEGDKRFPKTRKLRDTVRIWARKEFANLKLCHEHGVHVPKPVAVRDNVVVMQFLGEAGVPWAVLKDVWMEDPKKTFDTLLDDLKKMRQAGLVHADLSEYNIVMVGNEPYILDVGQAVLLDHPAADAFFRKDVHNLVAFFKRRGVDCNEGDVLKLLSQKASPAALKKSRMAAKARRKAAKEKYRREAMEAGTREEEWEEDDETNIGEDFK